MKKLFVLAVTCLLTLSSWGQGSVICVEGGKLQGVASAEKGVTVYKGVPYAAPPVGELRWRRPQPVKKWKGVKTADTFSGICPQPGSKPGTFYGNEFYWKDHTTMTEDCLYLNVWAPTASVGNTSAKLPVAVWIHGGAYVNGYGHEVTMDGDAWAKRGVILVTINYRLGIFGFLCHPSLSAETTDHTSGNYGTYDQVTAIKWVHDNIAQFGGDPDNIMVFGQSAGAASVKNMVASPFSRGYIRHAIIQSGGGLGKFIDFDYTNAQKDSAGLAFMNKAGLTSLKAMRSASAEQLLEIEEQAGVGSMGLFSPHIDGILLDESFDQAALNNHLANADYMIGQTMDDIMPMNKQIDAFCFLRDSLNRHPAYQYFFARKLPGTKDGAFHSAELWYMFGTVGRSWRPMTAADHQLSEKMLDFWTNFAKTGNPNGAGKEFWHPFTLNNPYVETLNVE